MIFLQKRGLILASNSPRRKEYFQRYGFDFTIQGPDIEEHIQEKEQANHFVRRMAKEKVMAVANTISSREDIILAADTIVVLDGTILGKPKSKEDSISMLTMLNGKTHEVTTAYAIYDCRNKNLIENSCTSKVLFFSLSSVLIMKYAEELEGMDKAGAYSIQGLGTFLIQSIEGSYNNVVGLPIEQVIQDFLLNHFIS